MCVSTHWHAMMIVPPSLPVFNIIRIGPCPSSSAVFKFKFSLRTWALLCTFKLPVLDSGSPFLESPHALSQRRAVYSACTLGASGQRPSRPGSESLSDSDKVLESWVL